MALCLSLTHRERCAAKFCAGKCLKFFRISHLRPNRDQNVVPEGTQNATRLAQGRSHFIPVRAFCLQISAPCHFKRICNLALQRKSATRLAQGRSHLANTSRKKGARPALHRPGNSKHKENMHKVLAQGRSHKIAPSQKLKGDLELFGMHLASNFIK